MGRSDEFNGGVDEVRQPEFRSVQQQSNQHFEALSVLDNVIPNQNGMGSADLQRRLVGSQGGATGRSESTFDRQLWLRHRDSLYRTMDTST